MRGMSLAGRSFGGQFAAFERELVWDRPHAGWVEFVGRREFTLRKSPFSEHFSAHRYVLPEGVRPEEGAFVELVVGRLRREHPVLDVRTGDVRFGRECYPVEAFALTEPHLPKPTLSPDEFPARLVVNWRDAELDHLDRAVALQLLSCPRDVYGTGGIGSQSFSMSTGRGPLDRLRSTLAGHLPSEFKRPHPRYEFEFIESRPRAEALADRREQGKTEEVSYNFLRLVDPSWTLTPIQVPTILHNAHYVPRSRFIDYDVIDFLLTALMVRPRVDEHSIQRIENGLRLIREQVEPESLASHAPFDPHAITRLAMTLCRLDLRTSLDDAAFRKGEHWFLDQYREFCDLRGTLFKPGGATWAPPQVRTSYLDARAGPHDLDVFRALIRTRDETGQQWTPGAAVSSALGGRLRADQVVESLRRLVHVGRVLQRGNWTLFRPLILD